MDSAKVDGVNKRKRNTRLRLANNARKLTIERGLTGFTIAEVCELAGVSRRTFFNYFASKEDAVVAGPESPLPGSALTALTVTESPPTPESPRPALSPHLGTDLAAALAAGIEHEFELTGELGNTTRAELRLSNPRDVLEREPQLMAKMIGATEQSEAALTAALAAQAGRDHNDAEILLLVRTVLFLTRLTAERYLSQNTIAHESHTFTHLLLTAVADLHRATTPHTTGSTP